MVSNLAIPCLIFAWLYLLIMWLEIGPIGEGKTQWAIVIENNFQYSSNYTESDGLKSDSFTSKYISPVLLFPSWIQTIIFN